MIDRRYTQTEDPFILADLQQMASAHNYTQWLYSLIRPFLGKSILEVGAGIGNMSKIIIDDTDHLTVIEPNGNCQIFLKDLFADNPKFTLVPATIEEYSSRTHLLNKFDTILCINVLEHIQDDQEVMKVFHELLSSNGKLVLIVPAVKWAFGSIDISVGHHRRYSKHDLQISLYKASFEIEKMYYFNFPGLLGWFLNSRFLKIQSQKLSQISLFDKLVPAIEKFEETIHPLLGMSIFIACRKSE